MQLRELKQLVHSTEDAAFAVDGAGEVVAWNAAAEALFGVAAVAALGQSCHQLLRGTDECGAICSPACVVLCAARERRPVRNFDLQVQTSQGRQWCNISVLLAENGHAVRPYSVHIIRQIDTRKRLEMTLRDFVVREAKLPPESVQALLAAARSPTHTVELSKRELEVLRGLAQGSSTAQLAVQLRISRATINNHIQHVLHKLGAHTRLEAVRRAQHAGLI